MNMNSNIWFKILWLSCISLSSWYMVKAKCNVCQDNGAACVNATSYHLCFGSDMPNESQLFTCNDGLVCTDLATICFQRSERPASCDDTDSCGLCNSNLVFACTSQTTFALCFGAMVPSNLTGTCPEGKICDASSKKLCVEETQPDSIVCNRTN